MDHETQTVPQSTRLTKRKIEKLDEKPLKKNKHCRASKAKWTAEEDEILTRAVMLNGEGNWKKIAQSLNDRSHLQCLHRWQKVLNPALVKGPWKEEEDLKLVELVEKYGPKDWSTIASHIQGRIGKQCRERWFNHLSPDVRKTNWTPEEDKIIIDAHQRLGNKWTAISKLLNGRPANAIKNHWNSTLLKRIQENNGTPTERKERSRRKHERSLSSSSSGSGSDSGEGSPISPTIISTAPIATVVVKAPQIIPGQGAPHSQLLQTPPILGFISSDHQQEVPLFYTAHTPVEQYLAWDWQSSINNGASVIVPNGSIGAGTVSGMMEQMEQGKPDFMDLHQSAFGALNPLPELQFCFENNTLGQTASTSCTPFSLDMSTYSPMSLDTSNSLFGLEMPGFTPLQLDPL